MIHTTRLPNGITNVLGSADTGNLGMPDPLKYVTYFNDYIEFHDLLAGASATGHTVTVTQAGTGNATFANVAGNGGAFIITNDNASGDKVSAQTKFGSFYVDTTKDFLIKTRFKVSSATNAVFLVGVAISDTTPLDATSIIGVQKAAATTTATIKTTTGGATTTLASTTYADDTFKTVCIRYTARLGLIETFVDGALVGSTTTLTNLPASSVSLCPTIHIENGTAAITTMTLDYLLVTFER